MISWTGFPSERIDEIWSRAVPLLRRGFESPELADTYHDKCTTGQAQLWGVLDEQELIAAFLTEIHTVGGRKVCNIVSTGGSRMSEWLHFLDIIERWARINGCVAMRHANCRTGWARVLTQYHTTRITLEKAL